MWCSNTAVVCFHFRNTSHRSMVQLGNISIFNFVFVNHRKRLFKHYHHWKDHLYVVVFFCTALSNKHQTNSVVIDLQSLWNDWIGLLMWKDCFQRSNLSPNLDHMSGKCSDSWVDCNLTLKAKWCWLYLCVKTGDKPSDWYLIMFIVEIINVVMIIRL